MDIVSFFQTAGQLAPATLMVGCALLASLPQLTVPAAWRALQRLAVVALLCAVAVLPAGAIAWPGVIQTSALSQALAVLVQGLGTVIAFYSARYLQGEPGQRRYVAALAAVLAAVHLLLLADHWLGLIAAWAAVGLALQPLLCFYADRPFALLAAHKKRLADRVADGLLLTAAALAWSEVGSGSLSALGAHVALGGVSAPLQLSAVALVLAVILRTALLPVHGWLTQVMEAPTPVSALLHAGVVNLGGFVLIRFAPLLEQAPVARALLLAFGLATAVLAGMVMLTRVSIKVRLAWSTVAQMGFMLLECALGLYTMAALHLIGHSLYKAHAFLSAGEAVRQTRLQALREPGPPAAASLMLAPLLSVPVVGLIAATPAQAPWPWWWSLLLGLAWAPLLWLRRSDAGWRMQAAMLLAGLAMVAGLSALVLLVHAAAPLQLRDAPHEAWGWLAAAAMAGLYLCLALLQLHPHWLAAWWRWSYAGFYVDEAYTRLALRLWPGSWPGGSPRASAAAQTQPAYAPR